MTTQAIPTAQLDVLETAVSSGSFETLAAALEAADLADALKGAGPFTVFAPTDEAFANYPEAWSRFFFSLTAKASSQPSLRITCCRRESLPKKLFISAQQRL
jgi:hypothetical protein